MNEKKEISITKEIRKKYGLTQAAMSSITGIPRRTIEDWDSGAHSPPSWLPKMLERYLKNEAQRNKNNFIDRQILTAAYSQKNVMSKALANYLFRQIIEDAHAKYNISQEDMKEMCKKAVNRANLYLTLAAEENPQYLKAFGAYAIDGLEWDEPELTEEIEQSIDLIIDLAENLKS